MQTLTHDGCDLAYDLVGHGPPVLFIQGVGVQGAGWAPQTEALCPRWACLSFDNRGMGASQPLAGTLTLERMAADGLALIDAQGWRDVHVVGHSMGGHIALALAMLHPGRVRSLTLMCTSARGRDMPPVTPAFLWTSLRSRVGTRRARRHAFLEMVLPRSLRAAGDRDRWAESLAPLFGHDLADTPPVAMKQIAAYRTLDARARLPELAGIPTLVVSAVEDPLSPPSLGRALSDGIPGARLVVMQDAAHGVPITHAAEINGILEEHLLGAERARA